MKGFNYWEVYTGVKRQFETYKRHLIPTTKNVGDVLKKENILYTKLIRR